MILLLHPPPATALNSQVPFHPFGGGSIPSSPNDGWLGSIPVSKIPITTPRPNPDRLQNPSFPRWRPRNPGERVVASGRNTSGYSRTHPSVALIASASSSVSRAAKPVNTSL
uniref:Uncharacterized protein n=1 Tax=Arundo donax TaxID=35708 RepID=A0A0A9E463_ARUDO